MDIVGKGRGWFRRDRALRRERLPNDVVCDRRYMVQGIERSQDLIRRPIADDGGPMAQRVGLIERDTSVGSPHNQLPADFEMKKHSGVRFAPHHARHPITTPIEWV